VVKKKTTTEQSSTLPKKSIANPKIPEKYIRYQASTSVLNYCVLAVFPLLIFCIFSGVIVKYLIPSLLGNDLVILLICYGIEIPIYFLFIFLIRSRALVVDRFHYRMDKIR
jgi:hypothetical protein